MEHYKFEKGFNIRKFIIVFSAFILVAYGLFNARNIIIGPTLELFSPDKDMETSTNLLKINGQAANVVFISINNKPIFIDTEGLFEEKLLLSPGSNIIEVKARDRFKQEIKKIVKIYYKPSTATSTETVEES